MKWTPFPAGTEMFPEEIESHWTSRWLDEETAGAQAEDPLVRLQERSRKAKFSP
jgi:hypothetical protein